MISYSDFYKYKKIIESIKNNDIESINKNLKLLASNIKILDKNLNKKRTQVSGFFLIYKKKIFKHI